LLSKIQRNKQKALKLQKKNRGRLNLVRFNRNTPEIKPKLEEIKQCTITIVLEEVIANPILTFVIKIMNSL